MVIQMIYSTSKCVIIGVESAMYFMEYNTRYVEESCFLTDVITQIHLNYTKDRAVNVVLINSAL